MEDHLLSQFAQREGLARGAALRELAMTALVLDALDADPTADDFRAALARVRSRTQPPPATAA